MSNQQYLNPVGVTPGAGDVSGPSSSVNGDIAIFSGTTGKVIADSGININQIWTSIKTTLIDYTDGTAQLAFEIPRAFVCYNISFQAATVSADPAINFSSEITIGSNFPDYDNSGFGVLTPWIDTVNPPQADGFAFQDIVNTSGGGVFALVPEIQYFVNVVTPATASTFTGFIYLNGFFPQ